jgi:hypothetical protein
MADWRMIIAGWANTVFYWVGKFSANRGLSVTETPYGAGNIWDPLVFLGGGTGMASTTVAVIILALSAFKKCQRLAFLFRQ